MKFETKKTNASPEEPVAALFNMEGSDTEYCLCLRTENPSVFVWLYEDGQVLTSGISIESQGKAVKYFYPGDSITITF